MAIRRRDHELDRRDLDAADDLDGDRSVAYTSPKRCALIVSAVFGGSAVAYLFLTFAM